jgi:hypothetical protein
MIMNLSTVSKFRLSLALLAGLLSSASAEVTETISRPIPEGGGATVVQVAMGLLDIDEIDSAEQNFTANLFIVMRWQDSRLAHQEPGDRVLSMHKVWTPIPIFVNQQKVWPTLPDVVRVSADGEVEYAQRVWGPFSQPLDVKDFPFDRQDFEMRVAAVGAKVGEVEFVPDPEATSGLAPEFSLPDWEIINWRLDFAPYNPMGSRVATASFAMVLNARRYVSHYLAKIILPLLLIVAMSWIVFWIDPRESGTQIGVATTSMLTLIAYRFMVGGQIPAVPYLTRMDLFILGSTFVVFAALMQAVLTSMLADHGKERMARRFDTVCRVLFPVLFGALTWFSLLRHR